MMNRDARADHRATMDEQMETDLNRLHEFMTARYPSLEGEDDAEMVRLAFRWLDAGGLDRDAVVKALRYSEFVHEPMAEAVRLSLYDLTKLRDALHEGGAPKFMRTPATSYVRALDVLMGGWHPLTFGGLGVVSWSRDTGTGLLRLVLAQAEVPEDGSEPEPGNLVVLVPNGGRLYAREDYEGRRG